MADDATFFHTHIAWLLASINILKKFGKCLALKFNLQTTEMIQIGKAQNQTINLSDHLKLINVKHGPFNALKNITQFGDLLIFQKTS